MVKDKNTFPQILRRVKRMMNSDDPNKDDYSNEILNFFLNIFYKIVVNFEVVLYNYFAPMVVLVVQMIGYYY